jgi:EAL domain-containing protein (putative c-di-GMP-specific phosphodiesterase class I)
MATRLNLRIVAEGVEDNVTIDRLIRMGCTIAQGYVFAKPMAKSEILTWLNDWHKIHNISLKNDKVHFLRGLFK